MVTLGLCKKWAESDLVVGVSKQMKEIWSKYQIVIYKLQRGLTQKRNNSHDKRFGRRGLN